VVRCSWICSGRLEGSRIPLALTADQVLHARCLLSEPHVSRGSLDCGRRIDVARFPGRRGCGTPKTLRPIFGREHAQHGTPNATPLRLSHQSPFDGLDACSEQDFYLPCPLGLHGHLALFAQSFDAQPHHLAGPQKDRRFHTHTYSRRSPSGDHIPRVQGHDPAQIAH